MTTMLSGTANKSVLLDGQTVGAKSETGKTMQLSSVFQVKV